MTEREPQGPAPASAVVTRASMSGRGPVRFRARWAKGRTGAVALVAAFAALAALWAAVPQPRTGEGSVDVTRLVPGDG